MVPSSFIRTGHVAVALLLACASAHAQRYALTDVGIPVDVQIQSLTEGLAINNLGQVVVHDSAREMSWLYTPGQGLASLAPALPPPQAGQTHQVRAVDINDTGQVIGWWRTRTNTRPLFIPGDAFVHSADAGLARLHPDGRADSRPVAINNRGEVVGTFGYQAPYVHDLATGSTRTDFPNTFTGTDINDRGQVAGGLYVTAPSGRHEYHAAVVDANGLQDLGTLNGNTVASAKAINDAGWVVGDARTDDLDANGAPLDHAFLYRPGVGMVDISDVGQGAHYGTATDVNDLGQVIGGMSTADGSQGYLFLYDLLHGQRNLQDLLDPMTGAGWTLLSANAINDVGQITGMGLFEGERRAYVLSLVAAPVPEPAAWLLLATGLVALRLRRR